MKTSSSNISSSSTSTSSSTISINTTGWTWGEPTEFIKSRNHYYQMNSKTEASIRNRKFKWGFGDFSKFIFHSKYSRLKSNGSKESWHDVAIRCTNGSMTLIKNHMMSGHLAFKLPNKLPNEFSELMANRYSDWNDVAKDMAEHIVNMRMLPPGRGLWGMGELAFKRGGMVLNNCGASSTKDLYTGTTWTMGALMYGCGIGFDTEFKGPVFKPNKDKFFKFVIPDTREGWVESLGHLIRAYVPPVNGNQQECGLFPIFDYSLIRLKGSPILTFGGTASGPGPLKKLHHRIEVFLDTYLDMEKCLNKFSNLDSNIIQHNQSIRDNLRKHKLSVFYRLIDRLTPTDFSNEDKIITKTYEYLDEINNTPNVNRPIHEVNDYINNHEYSIRLNNIIRSFYLNNNTEEFNKARISVDRIHKEIITFRVNKIKEKVKANIDRKTYDLVRLTVDIMNSIGACVVSGNVRRSSMLAVGVPECKTFNLLKDYNVNPERVKISYMSNNSIKFTKTEQYTKHLPACARQTASNGEPGYLFLLNVQRYGRIGHLHKPGDPITREQEPDKATVPNPCSEMPNEIFELCNVVEQPINRFLTNRTLSDSSELSEIFDFDDFLRSCVLAVIYAKSVSIFPTNEPLTNAVIRRNHRFGISITGGAQVHDRIGMTHYIKVLRAGYKIIRQTDRWLSAILGVRESIRVTTCKPSGTVSLLSGSTAGIHYSHSRYVKRRVRLASTSKLVQFLAKNGYKYEKDVYSDNTVVFTFGLDYGPVRSVQDVTMYEQLVLLQMYQREWADNMVSVTVTFDPKTESRQLEYAIPQFAPTIKSVSFLPNRKGVYAQMPLEQINKDQYLKLNKPIDWSMLTEVDKTTIPRGCTNDYCTR